MKPYKTLKTQSLAIALLFIATSLVGISFLPARIVLPITAALAMVGLAWRVYRALHRQIGEQQFTNFRQVEALTGLYATLNIQHPLPRTRHTAASPDFLHFLASEIFRIQPELIVELGSGTSTLIAAYCLKKLGKGKIVSLDHLQKYADITRQTVISHQLENFAEVIYAPIREYQEKDEKLLWYDSSAIEGYDAIDLLVVDGPPMDIATLARYPAIPLTRNKLNQNSVILLDDGDRAAESETVQLWKQRFGLDFVTLPMEKGAFRCHFPNND